MKHFVLFSMILIVASVIVLLMPQCSDDAMEGFSPITQIPIGPEGQRQTENPVPATFGRHTAAAADGASDQDHLLRGTLNKQDRLSRTIESKSVAKVSPVTTKKNGIATTGAAPYTGESSSGESSSGGCSAKCASINNTSDAVGDNCVNPMLPNTIDVPDYSKKYCPAFRPKDSSMREQECSSCGYYKYAAKCIKHADPKDASKCTLYGSYDYESPTGTTNDYMTCDDNDPICNLFHGSQQNVQGDQSQSQRHSQSAINVYHHAGRGKKGQSMSNSSTYIDPEPGTIYLGFF